MYNKPNSASRGAALCRSATASLHFESQAKFKGEKPWRQTLTSNDRTARVDRRSVNLFNPDESKNAAPSPMGVCPLQSLAHGLSVCTSPIIARLGWGNGPLQPVIEVSTESATPKPSCGKKGGELRAVRRWGPGPPLVEVLWCTDEYRLQRLQAAAADRWFWPVPRPHWQPSVVVSGLSGARSLRKGHNKVLICRSQLLKEFDFSTTTI
jgi:hypothetical protein